MKLIVSAAQDLFSPRQTPACFRMSDHFSVKEGVGHLHSVRLSFSFSYCPGR